MLGLPAIAPNKERPYAVMYIASIVLSLALMVPFFGWGVYTLRIRYQYHEELHRAAEWITIGGVAAFFATEMSLLGSWMYDYSPGMFAGTGLALTVSTAALYGHIMVSLASSVFVDAVMPNMDPDSQHPQFGPAESLERVGDYDGALQEYLVTARIFPKDAETFVRIASCLVKLERYEEAANAFARGFTLTKAEEDALSIANRLHVLYKERLNRPAEAKRILEQFLDRYPLSPRSDSVIRRIRDKGTAAPVVQVNRRTEVRAPSAELELESEDPPELVIQVPDSTWDAPSRSETVSAKSKSAGDKPRGDSGLSLDWSTADEDPRHPPKQ